MSERFPLRVSDASCPFGIGERVYDEGDERFIGLTGATIAGRTKVTWEETGWISWVCVGKLRRAGLSFWERQQLVRSV